LEEDLAGFSPDPDVRVLEELRDFRGRLAVAREPAPERGRPALALRAKAPELEAAVRRAEIAELRAKPVALGAAFVRQIALFSGVLLDVEELTGAEPARADEPKRPAREKGIVLGFGIGLPRLVSASPGEKRAEIATSDAWRTRDVERAENRRQEVDELDRFAAPLRAHGAGRPDDERDSHLLFVDARAVIAAAVVAELFAVIGGQDDDGTRPLRDERCDDFSERRVCRRDLRVVAVDVAIPEGMLRVRLVRLVGAEQVHPGEQRAIAGRFSEVALDLSESFGALGELDPAVLEVERAPLQVLEVHRIDEEDGRRVERGGAVAVRAQEARPRVRIVAHPLEQERPHVFSRHEGGH